MIRTAKDLAAAKHARRHAPHTEHGKLGGGGVTPAINLGFWLRFAPELESEFLREHNAAFRPRLRFSLWLALALYTSYLLLDALSFRRFTDVWIYLFIFGLCAPSVLGLLVVTHVQRLYAYLTPLTLAALMINALGLSLALARSVQRELPIPSEVLVLHLLYDFFLAGILFRHAVPTALLTLLLVSVVLLPVTVDVLWLGDRLYFLLATVALGIVALRLQEQHERTAWLRSRELREVSRRDGLTGLHNYRAFYEHGTTLLMLSRREKKPLAVVLLDLDLFKNYNDTQGHLAGDAALQALAHALRAWDRRPLDMSARLGGEEFALIWYDASPSWAQHQAEQLRLAIEKLVVAHPGGTVGRVTASLGLALHEGGGEVAIEELMGRADSALYTAKREGRNRVVITRLAEPA